MAIEFHCDHCGKLIRAGDEHGGKRGKCPACHQSVYIPAPPDAIEPLDLAPIDQRAEVELQRMQEESRRLATTILRERSAPTEGRDSGPAVAGGTPRDVAAAPKVDMDLLVISYAAAMAAGDLARAEGFAAQIRQHPRAAEEVMQRITVDQIPPPALAKIPRPVLVGFFKQLREGRK
jgi:hypothetical protein